MKRHWAWVVPAILGIGGWVLPMFEGVQMHFRWILVGIAGGLAVVGIYMEVRFWWKRRQKQKAPPAVAMDLERMSGMVVAFLNEKAREGMPKQFHDQAPEIRDPHEQRHVAYVRDVVQEFESSIKPQIIRHYTEARKLGVRDPKLDGLLALEITQIERLWQISEQLAWLAQRLGRRG